MAKRPSLKQRKILQSRATSECPIHFKTLNYCGQLASPSGPYPVGEAISLKLALWQRNTSNFLGPYSDPGLTPYAWLWMNMRSGSHNSLPVVTTQAQDTHRQAISGVYDLNNVVFTMAPQSEGDSWEIHLELKQADGTVIDSAVQTLWDYSDG